MAAALTFENGTLGAAVGAADSAAGAVLGASAAAAFAFEKPPGDAAGAAGAASAGLESGAVLSEVTPHLPQHSRQYQVPPPAQPSLADLLQPLHTCVTPPAAAEDASLSPAPGAGAPGICCG